ncbi:hypothetical protein CYJ37_03010 [Bacillus sp. UMB0728]|nr:hypothetical protein CYJ37_03010 [Bacillus sp. UMB0728]
MDVTEKEFSWFPMFQRGHYIYTHAVKIGTCDLHFTFGQETYWLYQLNKKLNRKLQQYILTIKRN